MSATPFMGADELRAFFQSWYLENVGTDELEEAVRRHAVLLEWREERRESR
jgi:hypothetical protein